MALTRELISANGVLNGLTDEQLEAIVTLSKNDEDAVFGQRIGEIYRDLDQRIIDTFGIQRGGNEKTRDFLTRASQEYAAKFADYDTIKNSVAELTKEKSRLEALVASGAADKELKTKYEQTVAELNSTKQQFTELQSKFDKAENDHKAALLGLEVDNELKSALAGLKLKDNLPQSAVAALTENALSRVKAMHPDFINTAEGKRVLVFRDENGGIRNNAQNQLNPFTASELLSNELKALGVLDEGRKLPGGGTTPPPNTPQGTIDFTGARTRVQADEAVEKYLMQQGFVKGTADFHSKWSEIRKENADFYKNLPPQ